MTNLGVFVSLNAQLWATLAFIAGALASWLNHARRGLAPWNPIEYWLIDDKPLGWGTLGAMATGIVGIWLGTIDGTNWIMLTQAWFASGLVVDSLIQRGAVCCDQDVRSAATGCRGRPVEARRANVAAAGDHDCIGLWICTRVDAAESDFSGGVRRWNQPAGIA